MQPKPLIRRVLFSTSDKRGLVSFTQSLRQFCKIDIMATDGTAQTLRQSGLSITNIKDVTGFPEMMDGRIKTLHPKIYASLLCRTAIDDATLQQLKIEPIDLIAINLYPFQETVAQPNCSYEQAIEKIDIGGPALLRAASKNHERVTVIVDPEDYSMVLTEIKQKGNTTLATRKKLAQKAFAYTAQYDSRIADYLSEKNDCAMTLSLKKKATLRYGENPHQKAFLYASDHHHPSLTEIKTPLSKPLSFNNWLDSDAALSCIQSFKDQAPTCIMIKHASPCGAGQANSLKAAYSKALSADAVSAFGGIVAFNKPLDLKTTEILLEQQFVEVILAPAFEKDALSQLSKCKNLRLLCMASNEATPQRIYTTANGLLLQDTDEAPDNTAQFTVVTQRTPSASEQADCLFAWQIVRYVKSNAIVYAKQGQTLGIGSGQASRVFSTQIAALKAKALNVSLDSVVMASDAFFPFPDSLKIAADHGVSAIIQPGGSINDQTIIKAADELKLAMIFTHVRHFRH